MLVWTVYSALLAVVATILARSLLLNWQRHQTAQRLGCKPVVKYPHTHLLGLDLVRARQAAAKAGRPNKFHLELFQKCGSPTYETKTPTARVIYTHDIVNHQALAATNFNDWRKDDRRAAEPFFGQGILSANGQVWRHARDLINPLFKRAELNDVAAFKKFVDRMMLQIPRDGRTLDMQPLLQKLFLDSSTEFIFGESIDSLRDTTGKSQEFLEAFNRALAGAGKRILAVGGMSYLYMFDKLWEKDCAKVHGFIDDCIARYFQSTAKNPSDERKRYVLIDSMAEKIPDRVELRFQLLNVFFPARESVAIATANTLFLLARNPDVWAELRKQALALGEKPITFELLKGLHLFRYTVYESLRLHSPANMTRRIAVRDTTLPRGGGPDGSSPAFIPKGSMVYLTNFPTMRDPSIWGDDVEEFRPQRFEGKLLKWEFTPFLGGPRICPASQQVVSQAIYLLVRLVREFESIENRDECFEFVEGVRMLFESRNGCKIALHRAQET